ncbi:allatotropins-like [Haliotis cracherodii]|uniref:allatotropins-like n=1 Tax=Haliotis rufescens TaxID=6454 RepID=UPI001EB04B0C|nr:allatotropins-like [Haliotis rufescens]
MMRTTLLMLGLLLVAVVASLPHNTHSRQKRGFRANSADRVAHGYGKRTYSSWENSFSTDSKHLLSVEDLANLVSNNPTLAEALIRKFVDVDDDGFVGNNELFERSNE